MRYLPHDYGVTSVAFAPDGTLFAHTERRGQLWVHPLGGAKRELLAEDERMAGWLEVSPDGAWVSVSGLQHAVLVRLGSPAALHTFPGTTFYQRGHFTGDSAAWVARTYSPGQQSRLQFQSFRFPNLSPSDLPAASALPCLNWIALPAASLLVIHGWSAQLKASGLWRVDVTQPDAPAELLGTVDDCHGLAVGPDGRLFVSVRELGFRVFSPQGGRLQLDLTVRFPEFRIAPDVVVSADGRRFVARAFRSKLVYAGDAHTGELFGPWDWKVGQVNDLAIAPDGLTAAAGGSNKKVVVWDLE